MSEHISIHVCFHNLCVHVHAQCSDLQADGCSFAAICSAQANFLLESFAGEATRQSKKDSASEGKGKKNYAV